MKLNLEKPHLKKLAINKNYILNIIVEEETQHGHINERYNKDEKRVMLIFFHEKICTLKKKFFLNIFLKFANFMEQFAPITCIEINHDESELRGGAQCVNEAYGAHRVFAAGGCERNLRAAYIQFKFGAI